MAVKILNLTDIGIELLKVEQMMSGALIHRYSVDERVVSRTLQGLALYSTRLGAVEMKTVEMMKWLQVGQEKSFLHKKVGNRFRLRGVF